MKIAVFGAGRIDVDADSGRYDVMDPFLYLCRTLATNFDEVAVEVNFPKTPSAEISQIEELDRFSLCYASGYNSFLNYFGRPENFRLKNIRQIYRIIETSDVIFLRVPSPVVLPAYFFCGLLRKPYLVFVASDLHSVAENLLGSGRVKARLKGRIVQALCGFLRVKVVRNAARCLFLSKKMAADYGGDLRKNSALFSTSIVRRVHSAGPVAVSNRPIRIIFVSRLVAEKGLEDLVDILARLVRAGYPVHADIVGAGRDEAILRAGLKQIGTPDFTCDFHGWLSDRDQIETIFCRADFCLLPSHNEGTPKIIFEAMATGAVFVGTRIGGIPDIVEDGVNGVLFDRGDTKTAADKISALISDPSSMERINRSAAQKARGYTIDATAYKLAQEIERCMHE